MLKLLFGNSLPSKKKAYIVPLAKVAKIFGKTAYSVLKVVDAAIEDGTDQIKVYNDVDEGDAGADKVKISPKEVDDVISRFYTDQMLQRHSHLTLYHCPVLPHSHLTPRNIYVDVWRDGRHPPPAMYAVEKRRPELCKEQTR